MRAVSALIACGAAAALFVPVSAKADGLEEVRLNVLVHDVNLTGNGAGGKESGADIQGELVFSSPDFLSWAGKPRPYLNASFNTNGETNFGGAGLAWQYNFTSHFYGEFDFGLVIHDGIVNLPADPGDPKRIRLDATRVILGSRVLFRPTFVLGLHLSDRWDAALMFEHLSHGQILASGRNEGLDNLGLRLSYKFGH
jgi:lipid A 3-O-deacylase